MTLEEFAALTPEQQATTKRETLMHHAPVLQAFDKIVGDMVQSGDEMGLCLLNAAIVSIIGQGFIDTGLIIEPPEPGETLQ